MTRKSRGHGEETHLLEDDAHSPDDLGEEEEAGGLVEGRRAVRVIRRLEGLLLALVADLVGVARGAADRGRAGLRGREEGGGRRGEGAARDDGGTRDLGDGDTGEGHPGRARLLKRRVEQEKRPKIGRRGVTRTAGRMRVCAMRAGRGGAAG